MNVLIIHLGPVDGAPRPHGHLAVDGDEARRPHGEGDRPSALVGDGQAVQVQISSGKLLFGQVHHAVAVLVQKVLRLHCAAEGPLGSCQRPREGAPPGVEVTLLVHGEVSVSDVDGALLHGQGALVQVQDHVGVVVPDDAHPEHVAVQHPRCDVVGHDGPVHGDGQPEGLPTVVGVAQAVHVPLPELVSLGVVSDVGNIEGVRAVLVPRDGDVARGGHVHDVGGVLLGFLEDVVGLGEVFDLVQHGGVGLVAHAGKAHLYRIPHFELGVLRGVQRDLQPGHREEPVQPVGAGDDPDLVQQLHRLGLHVQIVQVQGGKLQLQVVKLKVRQILPGLLQQHLGVAHIVPVHRLRDPAMARHCLVGLDVQASAVHALHRQIGV